MPLKDRQSAMAEIERLRGGRRLVALCNFDRLAGPANLDGVATAFHEDMKEPLYRVLKETLKGGGQIDLLLYTRGGATNAVWPIVSLLREFDPDFEVLIPFRAHSSGTLLSLAASKIMMTPIAELSPIDPTTANQFNPRDPANPQGSLGISVEDVTAYQEFWRTTLDIEGKDRESIDQKWSRLQPYLARLSTELHPLALGNVHRVYLQVRLLAKTIMGFHYDDAKQIEKIIDRLTTSYYSHLHMINRHEAKEVLGAEHIEFSDENLSAAIDELLRHYEDDFQLRHPFFLSRFMNDEVEKKARFIGGCVESRKWGYLHETKMTIRQYMEPPSGIQIQVPPGQTAPLVPGLPRKMEWQISEQSWVRNTEPKGVTT